jgi:hypothetical protein
LQVHLKAAPTNATPKLLKELAKKKFHQPGPKKWLHYANFNNTSYISDGLIKCLPPTQDGFSVNPKHYRVLKLVDI